MMMALYALVFVYDINVLTIAIEVESIKCFAVLYSVVPAGTYPLRT